MANFFRDSSMGFKPRTNIFNKLKVKETSNDKEGTKDEGAEHIDLGSPGNLSLTEDESDTSIANTLMLVAHDSGLSNETLQDQTSVSDISRLGESNNNKLFMNSSTPRTMNNFHTKESKQQIKNGTEGDTDDDEDFEITEVRNVEVPKTKQPPFLPEKNYVVENEVDRKNSGLSIVLQGKGISDSNSNDVLLEAFTNTQRICSNLKQELQRQQTENSKLKINLNTYENDFHKVSLKVDTFKNLLTKLEENGKVLLTQKDLDSEKISCLTKDYDLSKKRIMGFREDILTLRNQLNKLQDYKRNTDMELTKKSKEIEYLKRELDDCSGQLSEEKIRNGALTNEFGVLKEEIFKKLEVQVKLTDENIKEFISSNKLELYRDLQDFLTQQFKNEKALAFEKIDHSTLDITKRYVF